MENIAAGIVLYNPEVDILIENIEAIYDQVKFIVIVDNSSKNIEQVLNFINNKKNIYLIKNRENLGISKALNQIVRFCENKSIDWVITLDQDSVCPKNIISTYSKYISFNRVGIITLPIVDRRYIDDKNIKFEKEYEFIDQCITSASLINIEICKSIGYFDSSMFIDIVDFEYCIRVLKYGYKILRCNEIYLLHQLGELKRYKIFNKHINVGNHSPIRKYYYTRNTIYCYKKHRQLFGIKRVIVKVFSLMFKVLVFEKQKFLKLKSILVGIVDGIKMKAYN